MTNQPCSMRFLSLRPIAVLRTLATTARSGCQSERQHNLAAVSMAAKSRGAARRSTGCGAHRRKMISSQVAQAGRAGDLGQLVPLGVADQAMVMVDRLR